MKSPFKFLLFRKYSYNFKILYNLLFKKTSPSSNHHNYHRPSANCDERDMNHLLNDKKSSDIKFLFKNVNQNEEKKKRVHIYAHKCILAARSPGK